MPKPHGLEHTKAWAVALFALLAVGCGNDDAGASGPTGNTPDESSTGDEEEGSTSDGGDALDGRDVCLAASGRSPGRYRGDLSQAQSDGGACGQGGPDVFFRIEIERRSDVQFAALGDGFEPRVGVFGNDCGLPFDQSGLLCTTGVPGWVSDVPAGTDLFVGVGTSAAELEASRSGAFELEVVTRHVLEAGERCGPTQWGRCETGTVCDVADSEVAGECVEIPGDRCGSALVVDVEAGETTLVVRPPFVHTDAHRHGCGGDRSAERVYQLNLPAAATHVHIEGDNVLALAARGPTCLTEQELVCRSVGSGEAGDAVVLELDDAPPSSFYLFVEFTGPEPRLDDEGRGTEKGEQTPSVLRIRVDAGQAGESG